MKNKFKTQEAVCINVLSKWTVIFAILLTFPSFVLYLITDKDVSLGTIFIIGFFEMFLSGAIFDANVRLNNSKIKSIEQKKAVSNLMQISLVGLLIILLVSLSFFISKLLSEI